MEKQLANQIKEYFITHKADLLADLHEFVAADSPSNDKEYANRCCDVLCGIVKRRLGVEGKRFPQEEFGDHVMFKIGDGGKKFILIGHYDTVWDVGAKPTVFEGNIVKGAGVFDMKYGIISSIWSLKAVFDLKLPFDDKTVYLLYNSDEEVGSPTSKPIILENAEQYEAALVLEPSFNGGIKTERKGVGTVDVHITGLASHSGSNHEAGISAIDEAARITGYLHSLTDYEKGTTVNVGIIKGGTRRNVVAAECSLTVDFRVKTAVEGDKLLEKISLIKPSREGIKLDIKANLERPPFEKTPGNMALYKKLEELAKDMDLEIFDIATGGASDGNFTSYAGIPTIDGLGAVGDGGHALSEYVDVEKSLERTVLLCGYWTKL
ncbi:MAG: M20 family metallopeptidase [Defluviitaleaceae bacterium]|nr:M20 family metallopeptidase [Defluviitaleaceae bacterium]